MNIDQIKGQIRGATRNLLQQHSAVLLKRADQILQEAPQNLDSVTEAGRQIVKVVHLFIGKDKAEQLARQIAAILHIHGDDGEP